MDINAKVGFSFKVRHQRPRAIGLVRKHGAVDGPLPMVVSDPFHDFFRSRLKSPYTAPRFKPPKIYVATFNSNRRWPAAPNNKTRPDKPRMAVHPSREVPMIFMSGVSISLMKSAATPGHRCPTANSTLSRSRLARPVKPEVVHCVSLSATPPR